MLVLHGTNFLFILYLLFCSVRFMLRFIVNTAVLLSVVVDQNLPLGDEETENDLVLNKDKDE
tara:strand:- start:54 stop:239 length:186 start_codon:yes stop_codon:yes gene_type:complete